MRLVVVAYHHITDQESSVESRLYISLVKFEQHIRYIASLQVPVITTSEEIDQYRSTEKTVVMLTFDDAYENFYRLAYPVLKRFRVPGVLFVPTAKVGLRMYEPDYGYLQEYVTLPQMIEMQKSGLVVLQPHGHSHIHLGEMGISVQDEEIELSKSYFKMKLGSTTDLFCLPYGSFNDVTLSLLGNAGVRYVFTVDDGDNQLGSVRTSRPGLIKRYAFKSSMNISHLQKVFASPGMILYPIDASDRQTQD